MNKLFKHAFTLIELLVVIAIIGILSGLIVVSMGGMTTKATIAKAQVFSNSLRNSLMLDLVAEYKLDGNAIDSWGGHTTGTITGATPSSDCVQGACYSFNAANSDIINLPYDADLKPTNELTVSVWASMTSWTPADARMLSCTETGGYNITLAPTSCYAALSINGTYRTLYFYNTPPASGWHYFVFTYDGRYFKNYFDGSYKDQYDATAVYPIVYTYANNIIIGGEAGPGTGAVAGSYFTGKIDEIRFFKKGIAASQIKEQYYAGLNSLLANGAVNSTEYYSKIQEFSSIDF
jgi:prepilin-type N-terminal cleavage/methylation domain-containing protein